MIRTLVQLNNTLEPVRKLLSYTASPLFDLALRLYISWFFFSAGLIKLNAALNGNFQDVVEKFDNWYPVVIGGTKLDPTLAAFLGTFGEIVLPILLAIGLFSRFAALGLLVQAAVITFFTQSTLFFEGPVFFESLVMFIVTGALFLKGPGFFSLDHILVSALRARSAAMPGFKTQIGLEDLDTDLPGHESSGRFVRAIATGFWYTIIGMGILHFIAAVVDLVPAISLKSFMVVDMFSKTTPDTALAGYIFAIIFAYAAGVLYAVLSKKSSVVFTFQKAGIWVAGTGLLFMILHGIVYQIA